MNSWLKPVFKATRPSWPTHISSLSLANNHHNHHRALNAEEKLIVLASFALMTDAEEDLHATLTPAGAAHAALLGNAYDDIQLEAMRAMSRASAFNNRTEHWANFTGTSEESTLSFGEWLQPYYPRLHLSNTARWSHSGRAHYSPSSKRCQAKRRVCQHPRRRLGARLG